MAWLIICFCGRQYRGTDHPTCPKCGRLTPPEAR
jgi:hypothetical protein